MPATATEPVRLAHAFLTTQRAILLEASSAEMALRQQLAEACFLLQTADERITALEAQLLAAQQATPRRPTPSLRPAIVALLQQRGAPLTRMQIEEAMEAGTRLAEPLRDMVKAGRLVLEGDRYRLPPGASEDAKPAAFTLPPDPTRAPEPEPAKRGRKARTGG